MLDRKGLGSSDDGSDLAAWEKLYERPLVGQRALIVVLADWRKRLQ